MAKKITKTNFEQLDNFNFDFIDLLTETNLKKLLKNVKEEMILDCTDIEMLLKEVKKSDLLFQYLVNYTSKYSFFIYHFENASVYEACAEIRKMFKAMALTYFKVTDELLELMMIESVGSFREVMSKTK